MMPANLWLRSDGKEAPVEPKGMWTNRTRTLSRRSALRLLGGTAAAVAWACAPSSSGPVGASTAAPAAQPKRGGTIKLGQGANPANLDGHVSVAGGVSQYALDRLVMYDEKLQPIPQLAESWDFSTDMKQIKLNLRKGVTFHSGREFTSDDVKFNMLRVRDPKLAGVQVKTQSGWYSDIQTPDKYTIILKSDQSRPGTFDFFQFFFQVDRDTVDDKSSARLVGTGPWKMVEFVPGDHVAFTRNANYWQAGKPFANDFLVQIVPDSLARATQLESGALNLIDPSLRDAARLEKNPNYRVIYTDRTTTHTAIALNCMAGPTSNKIFRQALGFSLDRKRWCDTTLLGKATPYTIPFPKNSPAYDASKEFYSAYDLDKAKSLLEKSGVTNASIEISVRTIDAAGIELGQIWQADLAKLGVKATLKPLEMSIWIAEILATKYGGASIAPTGFANLGEASTFYVRSGIFNPNTGSSGFRDAAYSKLLDTVQTEPDAAKRKSYYSQLTDTFYDQSFCLIAGSTPVTLAMQKGLHYDFTGIGDSGVTTGMGNQSLMEAWLDAS